MRPILATLFIVLAAAGTIGAQNAPDLAGTWTFVSGTSISAAGGKPVMTEITTPPGPLGSSGTITKDESSFVLAPAAAGSAKTTCTLGGSVGIGRTMSGGNSCRATSTETGKRGLLFQTQRVNDKVAISMTWLTLDANGQLILQSTTTMVPHDTSTLGPIIKLVYRRTTPADR